MQRELAAVLGRLSVAAGRWVDKGCCRGTWKTAVPGAGTLLPRRMRQACAKEAGAGC